MTFDPFNDFEELGYLRNIAGLHDPAAVKEFEHRAFLDNLDDAVAKLTKVVQISYEDLLQTHRNLFGDIYPWAGQDRAAVAPNVAVTKGTVLFAHPNEARRAVEFGLRLGNDRVVMAQKPGEVMGYLAYGHPFLDGNGRTIMVVHSSLAERAGISVDWSATDKAAYLNALTMEIDRPGKGHLDAYLKPFVRNAVGEQQLAAEITKTPGLDGSHGEANKILGEVDEPAIQEAYRQREFERSQSAGHDHNDDSQ